MSLLNKKNIKKTKPATKAPFRGLGVNGCAIIIGTGLIGGSFAYALRKNKLASQIIGVEKNNAFAKRALELKIVDEILTLEEAIPKASLIILAIPVQEIKKILPKILQKITTQVVLDVGSTKLDIIEVIKKHKNRKQFVATHPMWGTEFSGPDAAQKIAFKNKAVVICNAKDSSKEAVNLVERIYKKIGMHIIHMQAEEHDIHTAYVSHISHITSFALANTVLQKEKKQSAIFELASGGFESTVRLAKSNAAMWVPIFLQNKKNVLDVMMELEVQIAEFKKAMLQEDAIALLALITNANKIGKILNKKQTL